MRGPATAPSGVSYVLSHWWWVWLVIWVTVILAMMFSRFMSSD